MDSENFNNHHGTSTAFLTNFTKTVKLTKTLIACHYWRWNSFSCDYFNKSWKLLESGFPDRYFGRSMWDRKPYCELSSHSLHHACACTCNGIHEISEHGVSEFGHMACQNSDIYIYFFYFSRACRRWVFWSCARSDTRILHWRDLCIIQATSRVLPLLRLRFFHLRNYKYSFYML